MYEICPAIELGGKSLTTLLSTCFTREIQLFVVLSASLFLLFIKIIPLEN